MEEVEGKVKKRTSMRAKVDKVGLNHGGWSGTKLIRLETGKGIEAGNTRVTRGVKI